MIDAILRKIEQWAATEDATRDVIIEGSRARHDHSVDRFSDFDLNLYITKVAMFTESDAWIKQFSPIWAMEKEADSGFILDNNPLDVSRIEERDQ